MSPEAAGSEGGSLTRLLHRQIWGLRNRIVLFFALGALLLSLVLSTTTYLVVQRTLISQRETLAERQTYINAAILRPGLPAPSVVSDEQVSVDIPNQLSRLQNPADTEAILYYDNRWFATDPLHIGQNALPQELRDLVLDGKPARMRFEVDGRPYVVIGVPIPSVGASFFDIISLDETERALSTLQLTLAIVSVFTTLGGAFLGRWSTRSVMRPLTQAAFAAEEIAGGNRTARLTPDGDADMDRLVLSFNRMVDALQGRIERDARFASDVSHELRSPLMTLASAMAVLQARRDELPVRSQTALDLLTDETSRFQRMVQDLLEISRTDGDQRELHLDEVLAGEFVERVVEASPYNGIPVVGPPEVLDSILSVDKRRMERVIGNLIENAARYAGGVVEISLVDAGADLRIQIDDNGPGVPEDERSRIFERFARGTQARARASGEGTGLGLSLVSEHVALHQGKVWVEDRPGGGARFVVQLPKVEL